MELTGVDNDSTRTKGGRGALADRRGNDALLGAFAPRPSIHTQQSSQHLGSHGSNSSFDSSSRCVHLVPMLRPHHHIVTHRTVVHAFEQRRRPWRERPGTAQDVLVFREGTHGTRSTGSASKASIGA